MGLKTIDQNFEAHRGVDDQIADLKRISDDNLHELTNFNYLPATEGRVQIKLREGTTALLDANITGGTEIKGIFFCEWTTGSQTIFNYGGDMFRLSGSVSTKLLSGASDKMWDTDKMEDRWIFVNGSDAPVEMNFNSLPTTLGGSPPTGKYIHTWHNHVFMAGMSANKNRLQWSNLGDKDTWSAGDIQDQEYGEITGLGSLGDTFYIFFKNHIKSLTGFASGSFVFGKFADVGCVSHYSIVSNGGSLFFAAIDGIYAIGNVASSDRAVGGLALIKLSPQKISSFWNALDFTNRDKIHGVNDPERDSVRWTVIRSAGSVNDRELIYNYHENVQGFAFHKGRTISSYALSKSSTGLWVIQYGESQTDSNGGQLLKLDTAADNDNGTAIVATAITKSYDFERPDVDKRFNTVTLLMKGEHSQVPVTVSYGVGEFPGFEHSKTVTTPALPLWDTAQWDIDLWTEDTFTNYGIGIRKMGKSLVMKIVSSTDSKRVTIGGWQLNAQWYDKRSKTTI